MRKFYVIIFALLFVVSACAQNFAPRHLVWEYPYFQDYPDSSIHFIVYSRIPADSTYTVLDTTGAEVLSYDLFGVPELYDFRTHSFIVTAILHEPAWPDTQWSYESDPSNEISEYFKALPPQGIDSLAGLEFQYIDLGEVPRVP